MKKRTVALLCAAVALLGVIFGGTMAWLNRGTDAVVNTFTTASVGLDLTETDREYIMAPGAVLDKDPKVVVAEDSADCYLFVKVEEKHFDKSPIEWAKAEGWTSAYTENGKDVKCKEGYYVYYREFKQADVKMYGKDETGNYVFPFLKDDSVTVSEDLKKSDMDGYKTSKNNPELVFTAYAIQKEYLKDKEGNELTAPKDIVAIWTMARDNATVTNA